MSPLPKRITPASGVMRGGDFEPPPNASPRITIPTHNHAGSVSDDPGVMRDAPPMGAHQRITDASGEFGNASPAHHSASDPVPDAVSLAVRLLARQAGVLPACTSCGTSVDDPGDILCRGCYASRRGPARVLVFEPARRRRTERFLAGRACGSCGASSWGVTSRGDAACLRCTAARTDSVRGGAA